MFGTMSGLASTAGALAVGVSAALIIAPTTPGAPLQASVNAQPAAPAVEGRALTPAAAIDRAYRYLGGTTSDLGSPAGRVRPARWDGTKLRKYSGGAILWHRTTGAKAFTTPLWRKYVKEGGVRKLGLPAQHYSSMDGFTARYIRLDEGTIVWKKQSGARLVTTPAFVRHLMRSGSAFVGMPVRDEEAGPTEGSRKIRCQEGWLTWNPEDGLRVTRFDEKTDDPQDSGGAPTIDIGWSNADTPEKVAEAAARFHCQKDRRVPMYPGYLTFMFPQKYCGDGLNRDLYNLLNFVDFETGESTPEETHPTITGKMTYCAFNGKESWGALKNAVIEVTYRVPLPKMDTIDMGRVDIEAHDIEPGSARILADGTKTWTPRTRAADGDHIDITLPYFPKGSILSAQLATSNMDGASWLTASAFQDRVLTWRSIDTAHRFWWTDHEMVGLPRTEKMGAKILSYSDARLGGWWSKQLNPGFLRIVTDTIKLSSGEITTMCG